MKRIKGAGVDLRLTQTTTYRPRGKPFEAVSHSNLREITMAYRLSMFAWKMHCAWCDVKTAFKHLFGTVPAYKSLQTGDGGTTL